MSSIRVSDQSVWLAIVLTLSAMVAGCGGDKPVGDAQKFHPEGIGMDLESRVIPGKPAR